MIDLSNYIPVQISLKEGITLTIQNPNLLSIIRNAFLLDNANADLNLVLTCIVLLVICFRLLHAFSRPPPVHRKRLPRRPALQILFKPDNAISSSSHSNNSNNINDEIEQNLDQKEPYLDDEEDDISSIHDDYMSTTKTHYTNSTSRSTASKPTTTRKPPIIRPHDLPDSFAPLLSSSQMEILTDELTCDLLHATHVEGSIRLHSGRHEIPLDKDSSRPQLILDVPPQKQAGGCKVTVVASIGSDGFSNHDDLDVHKATKERSSPLVKHAGIVLDPPLPLTNVAPTLIHFPTLFEDNVVKYTLRRIQIVRYALNFIQSMSSLIEKVLWIIESKCQVHLGKVSLTPLYKGQEVIGKRDSTIDEEELLEPQWRLSLSFSGHVLLFGWIPIPFINITLPTWIIPQPHALLENLLTDQPLASGKLNREKISEQRITLAALDAIDTWNFNLEAVATPPAISTDLSLPGGISVAVETMHGTDVSGGRARGGVEAVGSTYPDTNSVESMSMNSIYTDNRQRMFRRGNTNRFSRSFGGQSIAANKEFDANNLVPWKLELALNGSIEHDRIVVTISKLIALHDPSDIDIDGATTKSKVSASGSFLLCKPDAKSMGQSPARKLPASRFSFADLNDKTNMQSDHKSVASILLFPEKPATVSKRRDNLLQYDYELNIGEDTTLDAMSLSIGAYHPMLKGGTIITTILENIYSYGFVRARENSIIDMSELSRKRNILRHLPEIDLTSGIKHFFIPEESHSYSDDGQTKCLPEIRLGQIMIRVQGGFDNDHPSGAGTANTSLSSPFVKRNSRDNLRNVQESVMVLEGIKVVVDFGVPAIVLNNETNVSEFPELNIFDDQKLLSLLSGGIDGSIGFHLRPQKDNDCSDELCKNVFNPLERYEIDFSGSHVSLKITESNATLGHRRIIIPSESTFGVSIVESIVDMSFEGSTQCELHWDFQGASPILQVTDNIGENPSLVCHEDRRQVAILIYSLRQGRFNLNVSSVGGLTITQAVTSRENKEGLYDWKFFNAIVSPDEHSFDHMINVLHDKPTMSKILQVTKFINADLEKICHHILKQLWRAKGIFDEEGVSDPGKAIPSFKMARLMSLFLCGNDSQVEQIMPIVRRAVAGEGIDVMAVKEMLRKNISLYDEYAPEIDRAIRWVEVMLGCQEAPRPFVEHNVVPLSLHPKYKNRFEGIPCAKELYATLSDKPQLPLDVAFSALISRIAPYLSFRQIEYILQARKPSHWRTSDIRRLRYVYSIKKKVLDISESYGGLSFMPQSFFVSVFLGEATRASLRARNETNYINVSKQSSTCGMKRVSSTLQTLRQRRSQGLNTYGQMSSENLSSINILSPAGRLASEVRKPKSSTSRTIRAGASRSRDTEFSSDFQETFMVGDSLLGPADVAILLQAGLTSSMKGSTVVQLNQRMLLDLMASQPRIFAVAVLAEIGNEGNTRGLTSALMALLDFDQSSFSEFHRLDIHLLLESWLPGLTIPRRGDYLAGGRWASQSYYSAIFGVAESIIDEAEVYLAFKGHVQRVRHNKESDTVPTAKELKKPMSDTQLSFDDDDIDQNLDSILSTLNPKLSSAIINARTKIEEADSAGQRVLISLQQKENTSQSTICSESIQKYREAFCACVQILQLDRLAFHSEWFKQFYRRNYDALMIKSVYDNVMHNADDVREWLGRLRVARNMNNHDDSNENDNGVVNNAKHSDKKLYFDHPENLHEQEIIHEIIDLIFFDESEQEKLRSDPLVRLLISNDPGNYDFTIVSAMGVITEGKKGTELDTAFERLKQQRNVDVVRADTGTARSFEFNASRIEDAIDIAVNMNKPYGILGYSQGCANGLFCESLLNSGTPLQQSRLNATNSKLVCRQLLFSAANGSMHGPAMESKIHRLLVMCEQFFKYQQGYCSRAFTSLVLDSLTNIMDSSAFQKCVAGGGGTFLHQGCRAFWREAQHLPDVPTCVLRGVLDNHTTPESLQMISNLLTKHAGSPLHDSQVHVYDAVGRPIYTHNRNSKILEKCDMGGSIQRTHHWSPLSEEVKFVETQQDAEFAIFLCAKDRHIFPWCDVNARFGFIKYEDESDGKTANYTNSQKTQINEEAFDSDSTS